MTISSTRLVPHFSIASILLAAPAAVPATEVGVVGLYPGKAVVVINNGRPQTISLGERTVEGVKLLTVENSSAVFEVDGKPQGIGIGPHVFSSREAEIATLKADKRGHFFSPGSMNNAGVRFLVDTGASDVSMGASDAVRAGIDFRKGQPAISNTANGQVRIWLVRLNEVKVGAIVLRDVEAAAHEQNMPIALLGMSFHKRVDMQRNGEIMTLKKIR